jgi:hypothetical protein
MNFTITKKRGLTASYSRDGVAWFPGTPYSTHGVRLGVSKSERSNVGEEKACELMMAYPSLVKRPVLVDGYGQVYVGFSEAQYQGLKF